MVFKLRLTHTYLCSAPSVMLCASCRIPLPSSAALPTSTQFEELLRLLRSSYISPHASLLSHSALASSTAILAEYDQAIQKMQADIDEMVANRAKVQSYIDGHRALHSPVRRLPSEILCKVFAAFSVEPHRYSPIGMLLKPTLLQIS